MPVKVAPGVYSIKAPPTDAVARKHQYASKYAAAKWDQWALSVAQAKAEFSTTAAQNLAALKAAEAAKQALARRIDAIDKQIMRVRSGEITAREAAEWKSQSADFSADKYNASAEATRANRQAGLDLRTAQAERSARGSAAISGTQPNSEVRDTVNTARLLKDSTGNPLGVAEQWSATASARSGGLASGDTKNATDTAVLLYQTELNDRVAREAQNLPGPGEGKSQAQIEDELRAQIPSDMLALIDARGEEELAKTGKAGADVPKPTLPRGGVRAPVFSAADRSGLISELELAKKALGDERAAIRAETVDLPSIARRAQEVQSGTFGPTTTMFTGASPLGTDSPFREQQALEGVSRLVKQFVDSEIAGLEPDADEETRQAAITVGRQKAADLLRSRAGTPQGPRPITYEMDDRERAKVRRENAALERGVTEDIPKEEVPEGDITLAQPMADKKPAELPEMDEKGLTDSAPPRVKTPPINGAEARDPTPGPEDFKQDYSDADPVELAEGVKASRSKQRRAQIVRAAAIYAAKLDKRIEATPAFADKVFSASPGNKVRAIYEMGTRSGQSWKQIFEAALASDWPRDEVRDKTLGLLISYHNLKSAE